MPESGSTFDFGPFQLDTSRSELRCGSESIHLPPKAWQVLCYLADRPGALVGRRELLDAVWGDAAVVPQVLTNTIAQLRRALEAAGGVNPIETVPRRGFRLVVERAEQGGPVPGRVGGDNALVGRADELTALAEHWQRALAGERQVAFVAGPAGIGKTSLVETFATEVDAAAAVSVLWAGCIAHHSRTEPYFSLLSAFGDALRSDRAEALRDALDRYGRLWLAQIPGAVPPEELPALQIALAAATSGQLLREGVEVLEAFAEVQPVLLVLEDLHWGDASTLELLALLASRRNPARILVVVTYRPAEAVAYDTGLASLARRLRPSGLREVPLAAFAEAEVHAYLARRFDPSAAEALAGVALEQSAGVPLHLRVASDHYESNGWVEQTEAGWRIPDPSRVAVDHLPSDLNELIAAEFEALDDADAALLGAASLYGDSFAPSLLAVVLGSTADQIVDRCEALALRTRLLEAEPDETGERKYRFRHDVHRRVVEGLVREDAGDLHRKLAEALVARSEPADPSRVAHHFHGAREYEQSASHYERAAISAFLRTAYPEAIAALRAALGEAPNLPATHENEERKGRLEAYLGMAMLVVEGYGSQNALAAFTRSATTAENAGLHLLRFQAESGRFLGLLNSGQITRSVECARRARELTEAELPDLRSLGDLLVGFGLVTAGDPESVAVLKRALGSGQALSTGTLADLGIVGRAVLGMEFAVQGQLDDALREVDRAVAQADASGRPIEKALVGLFGCLAAAAARDPERALEFATRCEEVSDGYGLQSVRYGGKVMAEWARAFLDPARDTAPMRENLREMRSNDEHLFESAAIALLALLEIERGEIDTAQADVDTGLAWASASGEGIGLVDLWCAQTEIHRVRGDLDSAVTAGRTAVRLAQEQAAKIYEVRATLALGRVLRDRGEEEDAQAMVEAAVNGVKGTPSPHEARRARAFLRGSS